MEKTCMHVLSSFYGLILTEDVSMNFENQKNLNANKSKDREIEGNGWTWKETHEHKTRRIKTIEHKLKIARGKTFFARTWNAQLQLMHRCLLFFPQIAIAIGVLTSKKGEGDEPLWRQQHWLRSVDCSLPLLASEYQQLCIDSRLDDVWGNADFRSLNLMPAARLDCLMNRRMQASDSEWPQV